MPLPQKASPDRQYDGILSLEYLYPHLLPDVKKAARCADVARSLD